MSTSWLFSSKSKLPIFEQRPCRVNSLCSQSPVTFNSSVAQTRDLLYLSCSSAWQPSYEFTKKMPSTKPKHQVKKKKNNLGVQTKTKYLYVVLAGKEKEKQLQQNSPLYNIHNISLSLEPGYIYIYDGSFASICMLLVPRLNP